MQYLLVFESIVDFCLNKLGDLSVLKGLWDAEADFWRINRILNDLEESSFHICFVRFNRLVWLWRHQKDWKFQR